MRRRLVQIKLYKYKFGHTMEAIMRLSSLSVMFLLVLTACDSQHGQLSDPKPASSRLAPSTNSAELDDLDLKPASSRLDPSTDFADLVDLNQRLRSPSGQYVLSAFSFPTGDRAPAIILRISDPQGIHLDSFVTERSSEQRWALGWHQGEDTVVLQTTAGTTVYNITSDGAIYLMECPQPVYGETGLRLMQTKYPQLERNEAEQTDEREPE